MNITFDRGGDSLADGCAEEEAGMALTLRLFDVPALSDGDKMVHLSRRKAMALLAYLAVTENRHHRESLAALLWPESDSTAAYSALRNVLWILRQTSLTNAIRSDRNTVELIETSSLDVDVQRFRALTGECPSGDHGASDACAICEPRMREAVELWRGPFMRGFTVSNSVQFEDWQFAEGEALRREFTETLERMIRYYNAMEDWVASARCARRWLDADGLNELGYRFLMQALGAQGKRSEALGVYEECVRVLNKELGVAPEAATAEIAAKLRASPGRVAGERPAGRSRLPHALVPLIGREDVASRLEVMLLSGTSRLVTVVGLGGAGKTSLALHVARRIEDRYGDGACFVPVDATPGGDVVASSIVRSLGLSRPRDQATALSEQLWDFLRNRRMLIVLDGVDDALEQIKALVPVFRDAPNVQLLVTSRIALGAAGETTLPLEGLAYPDENVELQDAGGFAAVRLLRIASQRHGTRLDGSPEELAGMARLARILEGSPLGLEMAAGWRSALTWDEISDRVSGNLEFLVHMRQDVAPKHRTFAAVFEQAWSMLPEGAQGALRRLSTLRNSFTIDVAENVSQSDPAHLALLVNRGLLHRAGASRYEMHDLLRQFAAGKLAAASGEMESAKDRHALHYVRTLSDAFERLKSPDQRLALQQLERDIGNVRLAVRRCAERGDDQGLEDAGEGLFFYYDMRTLFEEARTVFSELVRSYERHRNRSTVVDAFLRVATGWFAAQTQPESATSMMDAGLDVLGEAPPACRLHAISNVIGAYVECGRTDRLTNRVRASIDYYRASGDAWGEGLALAALGCLTGMHDANEAERLAYQSLRLHREIGDAWGEGLVLMALASLAEARGDLELALTRYEESQRLSEPIGADLSGVIRAVAGQARMVGQLGDAPRSLSLAERAWQLSQGTGNRRAIGRALIEIARAQMLLRNPSAAKTRLEEAFALLSHRHWESVQAECVRMLVRLSIEEGDIGGAERWLGELAAIDPEQDLEAWAARIADVRRRA